MTDEKKHGSTCIDDGTTGRPGPVDATYLRRTVLAATGLALLSGCLQEDEEEVPIPDPVSLDAPKQCDYCAMVIENHPGTNAQIFYRDDQPEERDGPAWFCAIECAHNYHAERERFGWELVVRYVTDYSTVDYELVSHNDTQYISSHTERESFADADDLQFVVGTGIEGAMGPEHVPFSDPADVDAFVEDHGGDVYDWEELESEVLGGEG